MIACACLGARDLTTAYRSSGWGVPRNRGGEREEGVQGDASVNAGLPAERKSDSTTGFALRMDEILGTTGSWRELEYFESWDEREVKNSIQTWRPLLPVKGVLYIVWLGTGVATYTLRSVSRALMSRPTSLYELRNSHVPILSLAGAGFQRGIDD